MPTDPAEKSKDKDASRSSGDKAQSDDKKILPADEKTPESPDNLRRRAEWFQKRTGPK